MSEPYESQLQRAKQVDEIETIQPKWRVTYVGMQTGKVKTQDFDTLQGAELFWVLVGGNITQVPDEDWYEQMGQAN